MKSISVKMIAATVDFDDIPAEGMSYKLPKGFEFVVLAEGDDGELDAYRIGPSAQERLLVLDAEGIISVADNI